MLANQIVGQSNRASTEPSFLQDKAPAANRDLESERDLIEREKVPNVALMLRGLFKKIA